MRRPNERRTISLSTLLTLVMLFAGLVLAACGAATNASDRGPTGGPSAPGAPAMIEPRADPTPQMERRGIFYQRVALRESPDSNQTELVIDLTLPDACTEPRHAVTIDGKRVRVEVWAEGPSDQLCAQVLREETLVIPLGVVVTDDWIIELNRVEIDVNSVAREDPGSGSHEYGYAMIEQVEVRAGDGRPQQVVVDIQGALPDACAELVNPPELTFDGTKVIVTVQWQRPRGLMCAQVLRPFTISVDLGELEPGTYTLVVNDLETTFMVDAS